MYDNEKINEVGYKKPPRNRQFKKGQSGNPKGRPKDTRNFATDFDKELNALIPVTENGKRTRISKRLAIVKQAVNKAANGDAKAALIVLNEARQREELLRSAFPIGVTMSVGLEDELVMESIVRRIRASGAAPVEMSATNVPETEPTKPEPEGGPNDSVSQ
jgi:hypothetical protein